MTKYTRVIAVRRKIFGQIILNELCRKSNNKSWCLCMAVDNNFNYAAKRFIERPI